MIIYLTKTIIEFLYQDGPIGYYNFLVVGWYLVLVGCSRSLDD